MYDDDYWIQNLPNLKAIKFMEELDKLDTLCPNDIYENAIVLCENFDLTDDICRDCWKMNGGRK